MGWLLETLKEVPLSAVMKERLAHAEQRYDELAAERDLLQERVAELESENAQLRAQLPEKPAGALGDETKAVAVYLFRHSALEQRDIGVMGNRLNQEPGVLQYHLERLEERELAQCAGGNYMSGEEYWELTPEGRRCVIENGLAS